MEQTYPVVLLYHTPEGVLKRLTPLLRQQGISVRVIRKELYTVPLEMLLGLKQPDKILQNPGIELPEPMLVMHGFSSEGVDSVLKLLRENQIRIDLKAVTTPTNLSWTALQMFAELQREREAFRKQGK
ncbi:MAG: DUF3783 domain-containing protein [Butyricicoccus sp.]|nr:DUF3783 domain-containing protein [Clostridiales bacterium]